MPRVVLVSFFSLLLDPNPLFIGPEPFHNNMLSQQRKTQG